MRIAKLGTRPKGGSPKDNCEFEKHRTEGRLRIADCGLRIDCSIAQSEMGAMPLEVGGALRLRLEAVGRFEILDWRL